MNKDISPVLEGWNYEPGQISVRKIVGRDGRHKLQFRMDLGLLQMEMDGRPDGKRPHGSESFYAYHRGRLERYQQVNGTDLGFELTPEECTKLRQEALMYYHRYLSLFVLEDYPRVVRDTGRNLDLLTLCRKYAAEPRDRRALEGYRPYLLMMNTRARGSQALKKKEHKKAFHLIEEGIDTIRRCFEEQGREEMLEKSNELTILTNMGEEIQKQIPVPPEIQLRRKLDKAVKEERYEDAARFRDLIDNNVKTRA